MSSRLAGRFSDVSGQVLGRTYMYAYGDSSGFFCLRTGLRASENRKYFRFLTKNTKKSPFFRYNFRFLRV